MDIVIIQTAKLLAALLLKSDAFTRILAVVERWDDKAEARLEKYRKSPGDTAGDLKRRGAMAEVLELDGIQLSQGLARRLVEVAVIVLRATQGDAP